MQQQFIGMKGVVFVQNVELPSRIRCQEQYVREQKSWIAELSYKVQHEAFQKELKLKELI